MTPSPNSATVTALVGVSFHSMETVHFMIDITCALISAHAEADMHAPLIAQDNALACLCHDLLLRSIKQLSNGHPQITHDRTPYPSCKQNTRAHTLPMADLRLITQARCHRKLSEIHPFDPETSNRHIHRQQRNCATLMTKGYGAVHFGRGRLRLELSLLTNNESFRIDGIGRLSHPKCVVIPGYK